MNKNKKILSEENDKEDIFKENGPGNEVSSNGASEIKNTVPEHKNTAAENASKNTEEKKSEAETEQRKLELELEKKVKEIETLTDTMKRRQADFENYKKRMIKSQEEQKKMAIKDFALDILNINDDLLRAYDAACNISREKPVNEICSTFSDGFAMISKRIEDALKSHSVEEIDSLNKPFDPNFNEAVEIEESPEVDQDTITKVHQKGFRLGDYVIRAARVKVTKPKKSAGTDGSQNDAKTGAENEAQNNAAK